MLTPDIIKNKTFQATGKGSYRAEDVDSFMMEVSASYDQVFRENAELIKKMSILANKVEEYKKEEDSLRQALLSAQKLADQITSEAQQKADTVITEAKEKADEIITQAKAQADKLETEAKTSADETVYSANKQANEIIGGVNRKVTQEKLVLEMLQKEVSAFKTKMMDMYKEHLTLLDRLPKVAEEKAEDIETEEPAAEETVSEEAQTEEEILEPAIEELEDIGVDYDDADEETFDLDLTAAEDEAEDEAAEVVEEIKEEPSFSIETAVEDIEDDTAEKAEDAFDDIASGAKAEGFSLNLDDLDLDDDEDEETSELKIETIEPEPSQYAPVDDVSASNDDDDNGFSFKGFFKKK